MRDTKKKCPELLLTVLQQMSKFIKWKTIHAQLHNNIPFTFPFSMKHILMS